MGEGIYDKRMQATITYSKSISCFGILSMLNLRKVEYSMVVDGMMK
jgi:hypothetical protein